jgi:hypothetical protein
LTSAPARTAPTPVPMWSSLAWLDEQEARIAELPGALRETAEAPVGLEEVDFQDVEDDAEDL